MDRCLYMAKSNKLEKRGCHCPPRGEIEEVEERIYAPAMEKSQPLVKEMNIIQHIACIC